MKKPEEKAYLKRSRATWLQEKLDINYARANAIIQGIARATPKQEEKISKAIRKDIRASVYKQRKP